MLLVDTNVWLAAADRSSNRHGACAKLIADPANEPASTVPVIAETAWLLLDRAGPDAQQRFLAAVATGQITIIDLTADDWTRVHEFVAVYANAMSSTPPPSPRPNASTRPSSPPSTRETSAS